MKLVVFELAFVGSGIHLLATRPLSVTLVLAVPVEHAVLVNLAATLTAAAFRTFFSRPNDLGLIDGLHLLLAHS